MWTFLAPASSLEYEKKHGKRNKVCMKNHARVDCHVFCSLRFFFLSFEMQINIQFNVLWQTFIQQCFFRCPNACVSFESFLWGFWPYADYLRCINLVLWLQQVFEIKFETNYHMRHFYYHFSCSRFFFLLDWLWGRRDRVYTHCSWLMGKENFCTKFNANFFLVIRKFN